MALDPLELAVIAVMAVVLFIWGPQKIPEIARTIGRARREFESASRDVRSITDSLISPAASPGPPAHAQARPLIEPGALKSGDQVLIETARKLGIETRGKTRDEIQLEIIARAQLRDGKAPPPG